MHDILSDVASPVTGVNQKLFQSVASYVILKILKKHCISDFHDTLPEYSHFWHAIHNGDSSKDGKLTGESLKKMMEKIGIGKMQESTEDSHDHHNHDSHHNGESHEGHNHDSHGHGDNHKEDSHHGSKVRIRFKESLRFTMTYVS